MTIGCARGSSDFPALMKQWFAAPDDLAGFVHNQSRDEVAGREPIISLKWPIIIKYYSM
ncbi:uncharacterized protein BDV17DRAFT_249067, partial [Aspergillus undulatus]|uniref:uncharacterized protein n=1 Tax=Aspergillus undulatus TaxID=1810928 RepID=UPI003CCE278A